MSPTGPQYDSREDLLSCLNRLNERERGGEGRTAQKEAWITSKAEALTCTERERSYREAEQLMKKE